MIIIVMGIAGSGKTTIGKLLAENLQWPFYDADDFHPESNVRKMGNDIPLNDEDRRPWLENLRDKLEYWNSEGNVVVACSALKESYRKILMEKVLNIHWVFLKGSKQMILQRLNQRKGHFMKSSMLDSQLRDLEEPKYGLAINVDESPEHIIQTIRLKLKL